MYKFCVDTNTKLQATLRLYIKHIFLPHISFPHIIVPSSLHVQTLQSSPAGIVLSPTSYSLPWYEHTEIECDLLIDRLNDGYTYLPIEMLYQSLFKYITCHSNTYIIK